MDYFKDVPDIDSGGDRLQEKRKEIKVHKIEVKLVDFSSDKDEPAFDVETWIDGKPVKGGGSKQIFSTRDGGKANAKKAAEARVAELIKAFTKMGEA